MFNLAHYASMTFRGDGVSLGASFAGRRPLVERSSFDVHGAAEAYEATRNQGNAAICQLLSGRMLTRGAASSPRSMKAYRSGHRFCGGKSAAHWLLALDLNEIPVDL